MQQYKTSVYKLNYDEPLNLGENAKILQAVLGMFPHKLYNFENTKFQNEGINKIAIATKDAITLNDIKINIKYCNDGELTAHLQAEVFYEIHEDRLMLYDYNHKVTCA